MPTPTYKSTKSKWRFGLRQCLPRLDPLANYRRIAADAQSSRCTSRSRHTAAIALGVTTTGVQHSVWPVSSTPSSRARVTSSCAHARSRAPRTPRSGHRADRSRPSRSNVLRVLIDVILSDPNSRRLPYLRPQRLHRRSNSPRREGRDDLVPRDVKQGATALRSSGVRRVV